MKTKKKKPTSPLNSPKEVQCFQCQKTFPLVFVVPKWDYSFKNNWDYWTEKEEDGGKFICNECLLDLYYNYKKDYWKLVTNLRKRQQMRTYVYDSTIS